MQSRIPLSRNLVTYAGWSIALVAFAIGLVLLIADFFLQTSHYNALVTYMLIPALIALGVALALLGVVLESLRRRRRGAREMVFPLIDFNLPRTRRRMFLLGAGLAIFFGVSAVGTYRAFVFTESTVFCGAVCHQIMTPEYTAYQHSPHARVPCVECHIGEGADWYARSKVSGLRQVFRTMLGTYELPIEVPVRNLRPARETCEHCHWPEQFTGTIERVQWHYWRDEPSTPSRYHLLMKVGGAHRETGKSEGIHWHTSSRETVRYWPRDRQRLDIPWVEVVHADGSTTVYLGEDSPEGRPPENEIRTMDCIDCHNRPSHIYRPPDVMVNRALAAGLLDRRLPSIKERAVEILSDDYPDRPTATAAIRSRLTEDYPLESGSDIAEVTVEQAIEVLIAIYGQTQFPEQKVRWKTYPDHIGHRTFPGCFRCHNDEHESEDGQTISMECDSCHEFVFQGHGEEAFGPVTYRTQPFEHPGEDMEDVWEGSLCTDCHGPES